MQEVIARPPGMSRFPFYVHKENDVFISEKIRRSGMWEPFETILILSLLSPGDQFIDIGANIGWYTILAALRVGERGHVFAFEPDKANFEILCANVRGQQLNCVSPENRALGRNIGRGMIIRSAINQGDHRIREFASFGAGKNSVEEVGIVPLDDYLAQANIFNIARLRVVKLDVQGFEHEVLAGGRQLFSNLPHRTLCFIEFDPVLLSDHCSGSCSEFVEMLENMQRDIFAIRRPLWRLQKLSIKDLHQECLKTNSKSQDLLIAHRDCASDLHRALPLIPRFLTWWNY
ncbi:MAG: FkbM family methyltransferase [Nitrospirae bacterium]|nr:FkbM family methyltransferase [Nitrospirota bacterium]